MCSSNSCFLNHTYVLSLLSCKNRSTQISINAELVWLDNTAPFSYAPKMVRKQRARGSARNVVGQEHAHNLGGITFDPISMQMVHQINREPTQCSGKQSPLLASNFPQVTNTCKFNEKLFS